MQNMKPICVQSLLLMSTYDYQNDFVIACSDSLLSWHHHFLFYLIGLLFVMRSGYFIIILNTIGSGSVEETGLLTKREVEFIQRRPRWVDGGIFKELSFMIY